MVGTYNEPTSLISLKAWPRPLRHLLARFLGLALVPAGCLVWLGLRLLEQDRALELQRLQGSRGSYFAVRRSITDWNGRGTAVTSSPWHSVPRAVKSGGFRRRVGRR